MIADSPPSPQIVGLEFVRQYYTVLNKAPTHLHRFYSNDSSFVHARPDTTTREERAVYGQVKIHQKILELGFKDCHAKIRQVDSHATLGQGVVIQVSGELSNDGEPMRRFMQTFVLAPQSPKKYYVHNDIFRYQDEVFNDDDNVEDGLMDEEEDAGPMNEQPHPTAVANMNGGGPQMMDESVVPVPVATVAPIPVPVPVAVPVPVPQMPAAAQIMEPVVPVHTNAHAHAHGHVHVHHDGTTGSPMFTEEIPVQPPAPVPIVPVAVPVSVPVQAPVPVPAVQPVAPMPVPVEHVVLEPVVKEETPMDNSGPPSQDMHEEDMKLEDEVMPNASEEKENKAVAENVAEPMKNEPKTYANLFKSGGGAAAPAAGGSPVVSAGAQPAASVVPAPKQEVKDKEIGQQGQGGMTNHVSGGNVSSGPTGGGGGPAPSNNGYQRDGRYSTGGKPPYSRGPVQQQQRSGGPLRERKSYYDDDQRQGGREPRPVYADSQQIFVGNLPDSANKEELIKCFSHFGTVLEVRILVPNQSTRPADPNRPCPNYGFVIFENSDTVQDLLKQASVSPITLHQTRLNVEEKKARRDNNYPGSRSGGGGGSFGGDRYSGDGSRSGGGGRRSGMGERGGGEGRGGGRGGGGSGRGYRGGSARSPNSGGSSFSSSRR